MSQYTTDTLTRGQSGQGSFPLVKQEDIKIAFLTVADLTARNSLPAWQRIAHMTVYVASTDLEYTLGTDLTIAGQVWTQKSYGVPANVLVRPDVFGGDGYINPALIKNVFLNTQYVVVSQAAMLALTTYTGNFIIRTDTGQVYIKLNNTNPASLSDFALATASAGVVSVNGNSGVVTVSIANLLAVTQNTTDFNTAVGAAPAVTALQGSVSTLQTNVSTLSSNLTALDTYSKGHIGTTVLDSAAVAPAADHDGYVLTYVAATTSYALLPSTGGVGGGAPFFDNISIVKNYLDPTKQFRFNAAAITTATTRVYTLGDANYTLAARDIAQTFTGKQTFTPTGTVSGINVGGVSSDPSGVANGDIWYNTTLATLRGRANGASFSIGTGGGGSVLSGEGITVTGGNTINLGGVIFDDIVIDGDGFLAAQMNIGINTPINGFSVYVDNSGNQGINLTSGNQSDWTGGFSVLGDHTGASSGVIGIALGQSGAYNSWLELYGGTSGTGPALSLRVEDGIINYGIAMGRGGMTFTLGSDATGDMFYRASTGKLTRLALPVVNRFLISNGTIPAWSASTIILGGNFTTSGAFTTTLTTTANTSVTLPTSGTLATLAGTETFTNKTLTTPTITNPTVSTGTFTSPQLNTPKLDTTSTVGQFWRATGTSGQGGWSSTFLVSGNGTTYNAVGPQVDLGGTLTAFTKFAGAFNWRFGAGTSDTGQKFQVEGSVLTDLKSDIVAYKVFRDATATSAQAVIEIGTTSGFNAALFVNPAGATLSLKSYASGTVAWNGTGVEFGGGNSIKAGTSGVAIGSTLGGTLTSGSNNIQIGASMFTITTGSNNSFFGKNIGITGAGMTGNYNLVLGQDNFYDAAAASYNILIGNFLDIPTTTTSRFLNIGNVLFGINMDNSGTHSITPVASGNIGIGLINPTARIHLAAGTATAGSAPIKLTTGTALGTIEDGVFEYHSSHLYFTIGASRYQLDQQAGGGFTSPMTSVGDLIIGGASGAPLRLAIGTNTYVLTSNGTTATWAAATGGGVGPFADNVALVKNNTDNTKLARFDASGITTGTTRVYTLPNASMTFARSDAAQTFTGVQTFTSAPVFSAAFIIPNGSTATTQTAGDNSTKVATTAYVDALTFPAADATHDGYLTSTDWSTFTASWRSNGATTITANTSQSGAFTNTFAMLNVSILQPVITTGSPNSALNVTAGAHTGLAALSQFVDIYFNMSAIVTRAGNATHIGALQSMLVSGRTYAFTTTPSIVDVATTLQVSGPSGGTNGTIALSAAFGTTNNVLANVTNGYGAYFAAPTGATNNYSLGLSGDATMANGGFDINGGLGVGIATITSSPSFTTQHHTLLVDTTAGNVTITLPSASTFARKILVFKKIIAANTLTINTPADGSKVFTTQWTGCAVQSNGTSWYVIASF